jgi:bifunctional UDP-N-acetylglucosamine pyrophosphorylase/glucosamine-1-phosphate N-acetyltransferase
MSRLGAIVLAAGHGTRMRSSRPKVLHCLAGRPMLGWVLEALEGAGADHAVVVVAPGSEAVRAALPEWAAAVEQPRQLGTGDAARVGLAAVDPRCDTVLVLCGDTPLVDAELVTEVVRIHAADGSPGTLVTAVLDDPGGYGRVVRDREGLVARVVEDRDASPEELALSEVSAGLYAFDRSALARGLEGLGTDNAQGEAYLPDALPRLGGPVRALVAPDPSVVLGVNTRVELAACEAVLQQRLRERLMLEGVAMPDPSRVYVEAGVSVGRDTVLWPGTFLRGATQVGEGCEIGPDVLIRDGRVGPGSVVVMSHLVGVDLGAGVQVGPYCSMRPGTRLADHAKAGTFVETKNADIGERTKVPHLSYIGDASIGSDTNIGAGNITANYDGFRKHRTEVGARVRTASDCVMVAPVRIGDGAMTAAGSVITDDVPAGALAIARTRQTNKEGYVERLEARARARAGEGDGQEV